MYTVLIRTPSPQPGELGVIKRFEFPTLEAAVEAVETARRDGKDAVVLRPPPVRSTGGPDGIIRDIQWR